MTDERMTDKEQFASALRIVAERVRTRPWDTPITEVLTELADELEASA